MKPLFLFLVFLFSILLAVKPLSAQKVVITGVALPAEGGEIKIDGTYDVGQLVLYTITARPGYKYAGFLTLKTAENPKGFVIMDTTTKNYMRASSNVQVVVTFLKLYNITAGVTPPGLGTITGAGEIPENQMVTLKAAASSGYKLANWTEGNTIVSTDSNYQFNNTKDRTLMANFKKIFTITTSSKPVIGGTIDGGGVHYFKDSITVTAKKATGYDFVNWTQGAVVVSASPKYGFAVTANRTLVANFKPIPYKISAQAIPLENGVVADTGTFNFGQTITIKAIPNTGIDFFGWIEGDSIISKNTNYQFVVSKNRNLVARFKKPFIIGATGNPAANGTVQGAGKYYYQDSVTLEAFANDGYKFKNWTYNGSEVSTSNPYKFLLTSGRNLVANFVVGPFSIRSNAIPASSGTVTGTGNYDRNSSVQLNATAATGFHFLYWTENDIVISTTPSLSFPADRSRKLVAQFTKYSIGELNQGGVIFHLWNDSLGGMHGLAVAINDQATKISWREGGTGTTGALSTTDGPDNCRKIVAYRNSGNSAAKICMDYQGSSLSDWYLPAIDELKLLFDALPKGVNAKLNESNGQFVVGSELNSRNYWSSTETSSSIPAGNTIYYVSFYDGKQVGTTYYGPYPCNVRAIRKF